jgi:hypothetical protein
MGARNVGVASSLADQRPKENADRYFARVNRA